MPQRVIGLIGGMSWKSSAEYYRLINEGVRGRLGGAHSARRPMWSFDFALVEELQRTGRWDEAAGLMVDAARRLERGGADFLVIRANTMHRMADEVAAAVAIPLLHIVDPAAAAIRALGVVGRSIAGAYPSPRWGEGFFTMRLPVVLFDRALANNARRSIKEPNARRGQGTR
jgi:aspartate racemase